MSLFRSSALLLPNSIFVLDFSPFSGCNVAIGHVKNAHTNHSSRPRNPSNLRNDCLSRPLNLTKRTSMITKRLFGIFISIALIPMAAVAQGLDTTKIDQALGRSGQKTGEVYRVGFPRTDLQVTVAGVAIKPGLALGSWAAFSGSDANASVMGDLVLLESEVNPVMSKLRASGIEITAVHNHVLSETPQVLYMHYFGHGNAVELAKSVRAALAVSKTPLGAPEI